MLRATEGFTAALPGLRRRWLPMNSSMIATEPIPEALWDDIGWDGRETVGDIAHGFFYAQRTVDDRIAIGGRSVPYRYASRTDVDGRVGRRHHPAPERGAPRRAAADARTCRSPTAGAACSRCRATGRPASSLDRATGLGAAGGYVGHGVTATNLAGRTLADLVLKRQTPLTELPWVGHRSGNWEPEPLRWLGVRGLYVAYKLADRHESRARATTSPIAASPT